MAGDERERGTLHRCSRGQPCTGGGGSHLLCSALRMADRNRPAHRSSVRNMGRPRLSPRRGESRAVGGLGRRHRSSLSPRLGSGSNPHTRAHNLLGGCVCCARVPPSTTLGPRGLTAPRLRHRLAPPRHAEVLTVRPCGEPRAQPRGSRTSRCPHTASLRAWDIAGFE